MKCATNPNPLNYSEQCPLRGNQLIPFHPIPEGILQVQVMTHQGYQWKAMVEDLN